jgi:hypothetical protein
MAWGDTGLNGARQQSVAGDCANGRSETNLRFARVLLTKLLIDTKEGAKRVN